MKKLNTTHTLHGQTLRLLVDKAVFWEEAKTLIVSDIHLGKAGHFRKAGIPIPKNVHQQDFIILNKLIVETSAETIIFLGDLFHSEINEEWHEFESWLGQHGTIRKILVKGNHDILPDSLYTSGNMEVYENIFTMTPFIFSHIPLNIGEGYEGLYNLAGHIHPAVKLQGKGRQAISLPCYYFGRHGGLLPAFGQFTGKANIKINVEDKIFLITQESVFSA